MVFDSWRRKALRIAGSTRRGALGSPAALMVFDSWRRKALRIAGSTRRGAAVASKRKPVGEAPRPTRRQELPERAGSPPSDTTRAANIMRSCYLNNMISALHSRIALAITLAGAVAVLGCSANATGTAPTSVAEDSGSPETSTAPDASTCDPLVAAATVDEALLSTEPGTDRRVWIVRAKQGTTFLTLTVRENAGGKAGKTSGTFGAEQLTPSKAGVALLVQTECTAHDDHFHCGPSYVPTAGTFTFAALDSVVGGAVAVELTADLVEVRVTGGVARPSANARVACFRGLELSGKLTAP